VALVFQEELARWEAGLDGQHVGGGTHETVGGPPLNLVPKGGELPSHMDGGCEGFCAIAQDGKEEGGGQSVAQERREAYPRRGESLDRHEGCLGLGKPLDEMRGRGDRGGEPVAQPPDLILGFEDRPIQVDRSVGYVVSVSVRSPVDELCFGDCEADA